jgi:hypothetical protein
MATLTSHLNDPPMSNLPTDSERLFSRDPDLVAVPMDGELVMLSLEQGSYYGLDGIGPRIWELIGHPISLEDLTATLCLEYDIDPDTCRLDVSALLDDMISAGIVSAR